MSLVKDEDKNQVTFQFPFANKAMKFGTRKSATDRVVGTGTWLFYMPSVSSPKIQLACSRDIYDGGWMLILVPVHRHTLLLKVHAYNKLLKSPFVIERSSGTRDIIGIPLFFSASDSERLSSSVYASAWMMVCVVMVLAAVP